MYFILGYFPQFFDLQDIMAVHPFEHSFASLIVVMTTHVGPSNPVQPIDLSVTDISSNSALVQWVVPYIAYTPEEYVVYYGTTQTFLNQWTSVLSSPTDLSVTNTTYASNVTGLEANRAYYFYINSTNSYGGVLTMIMNFTTLEAGKSYC